MIDEMGDSNKEPLDREAVLMNWALMSEWWCVPVDQTEEEKQEMLIQLRTNMSDSFVNCPLEYIEDRLFGGLACFDYPDRRHVCFSTGSYSFRAAEEGRYWPNSKSDRQETWKEILAANPEHVCGDGPFTEDFSGEIGGEEAKEAQDEEE